MKRFFFFLALVFCQVCPGLALEKPPVPEAANLVATVYWFVWMDLSKKRLAHQQRRLWA